MEGRGRSLEGELLAVLRRLRAAFGDVEVLELDDEDQIDQQGELFAHELAGSGEELEELAPAEDQHEQQHDDERDDS